ncbi:MAG: hypothetical protein WCA21_00405 [Terracidiphilus sp.]
MSIIFERKSQTIFISASSVKENGKMRKIVIESRPTFAIVKPQGSTECFPIAWELIYETAKRRYAENLRLEAEADKAHRLRKKGPAE